MLVFNFFKGYTFGTVMNDEKLLIKVACYYYQQELTQNQIAVKLGMSRQRVNRLLKRSRDEGIVDIRIRGERENHIDLETALELEYGLLQAVVVTTPEEERLHFILGNATAQYMQERIHDGMTVGISWGRTIHEAAELFDPPNKLKDIQVLQMVGNMNNVNRSGQPDEVTRLVADKLNGEARLLFAPVYVKNKITKYTLIREESIRSVLDELPRCDIAFLSVSHENFWKSYVNEEELKEKVSRQMEDMDAAGNICLMYYDRNGQVLPLCLHELIIGIDFDVLKTIPNVVCSAGGREKRTAILGALHGKLLNTLITDYETAVYLLDNSPNHNR
ncbi:MAG: sugar-binding transcriptional regulator [Spirochaetales bacterium]|nr:sugar-binding transcriptional regulator [Spirochaetales bacterium]